MKKKAFLSFVTGAVLALGSVSSVAFADTANQPASGTYSVTTLNGSAAPTAAGTITNADGSTITNPAAYNSTQAVPGTGVGVNQGGGSTTLTDTASQAQAQRAGGGGIGGGGGVRAGSGGYAAGNAVRAGGPALGTPDPGSHR